MNSKEIKAGVPSLSGEALARIAATLTDQAHPFLSCIPETSFAEDGTDDVTFTNDIAENGLRFPVVVTRESDGGYLIVDGRRRFRACRTLEGKDGKRRLRVRVLEGEPAEQVASFILSANLHRRHLTISQRAMIGGRWEDGKFSDQPGQDARAKLLGISTKTLGFAVKVLKSGNLELIDKVDRGTKTVSAAANTLSSPKSAADEKIKTEPPPTAAATSTTTAEDMRPPAGQKYTLDDLLDDEPQVPALTAAPVQSATVELTENVVTGDDLDEDGEDEADGPRHQVVPPSPATLAENARVHRFAETLRTSLNPKSLPELHRMEQCAEVEFAHVARQLDPKIQQAS